MSTERGDLFENETSSNCCGAKVYAGGLCKDCGEHCEAIADEDELPEQTD